MKSEYFEMCRGYYSGKDLLNHINGSKMYCLYNDVVRSMSIYYSVSDARCELVQNGRIDQYSICFNVKAYGVSCGEGYSVILAALSDCPLAYFSNACLVIADTSRNMVQYTIGKGFENEDAREYYKMMIEREIASVVNSIEKHCSEIEKAEFVYSYICRVAQGNKYNVATEYPQMISRSILGFVVQRKSESEGYAKAFQAFMNYLGIDCLVVREGSDFINLVRLCNSWHVIDILLGINNGNGFCPDIWHRENVYQSYKSFI